MDFTTGKELLELCRAEGITIAEAMQRREESVFETNRREIRAQMEENLSVMEESIRLGMDTKRSQSGLSGGRCAAPSPLQPGGIGLGARLLHRRSGLDGGGGMECRYGSHCSGAHSGGQRHSAGNPSNPGAGTEPAPGGPL